MNTDFADTADTTDKKIRVNQPNPRFWNADFAETADTADKTAPNPRLLTIRL